jgi:undecaprenyl-diphosphatase
MMDQTLLTFFNQTLAHPLLDTFMLTVTYGGLALLPGLGIVLLFGQRRKVGLAILAAIAASLALTLTFQYLALRPRPEGVRLLLPTPNFPSFPSGHAATAFAVALVLALTYRRGRWWALALTGASLIAFSRVYLGYHYPSDIVGGAALGAGIGAASYGLIVAARVDQPAWRWLLWPQIAIVVIVSLMAYLDILPWPLLKWPMADKTLHFLLFGAVVFWLNLWLEGRGLRLGRWLIPLAILLPLLIASSDEVAQFWSPVRTADLSDWSSDLAGMLFFWWLSCRAIKSKLTKPASSISITGVI